jgi:hypothetical protein
MDAFLFPFFVWTSLTFVLGIAAGWSLASIKVVDRERAIAAGPFGPVVSPTPEDLLRAGGQ